jgi:hypothetical protein
MPNLDRGGVMAVLLILPLVALLHANWDAPLYFVDDDMHLRPVVEEPVSDLFKSRKTPSFPIPQLSYRLDLALFAAGVQGYPTGQDALAWAAGMRLMNGFYFLLAALALWSFLRRVGAGSGAAALVALAWAAHPLACESVCWIAQRRNVLMALFSFSALLCWTLPAEQRWRWPLICFFYTMALFSKAAALGVLPLLLLLECIDPVQRQFKWREWRCWASTARHLAMLLPSTVGGMLFAYHAAKGDIVEHLGGNIGTALLTNVEILGRYFFSVLLPKDLSFYYAVQPIVTLADSRLWLYALGQGGVIAVMWRLARPEDRRLTLLGLLWFYLAIGPSSNVVGTPFPMQDRFIFLSTPGLLLAIVLAARGLATRVTLNPRVLPASAVCWLAALLVATSQRSYLFSSSDLLELDAAARQPRAAYAQICAGRLLRVRVMRHLPDGANPDPAMARAYAMLAIKAYDAAEQAPDLRWFSNSLVLRIYKAEALLLLERFADARNALQDFLPPAHLKPLPAGRTSASCSREEFYSHYQPVTLAHGWAVMGEASLRQSYLSGLNDEQRLALCQQAESEALKSQAASANDYEADVLRARILLRRAEIGGPHSSEARAQRESAAEMLRRVPETSMRSETAKALIAYALAPHLAPEPPKPHD